MVLEYKINGQLEKSTTGSGNTVLDLTLSQIDWVTQYNQFNAMDPALFPTRSQTHLSQTLINILPR